MTAAPSPTLGRIVLYRSRTGDYDVPAVVTGVYGRLAEKGVRLYEESGTRGVPPLGSPLHVHLTCLTPGLPGVYPEAADMPSVPAGGTYQEWNVPPASVDGPEDVIGEWLPGSWRWPERA